MSVRQTNLGTARVQRRRPRRGRRGAGPARRASGRRRPRRTIDHGTGAGAPPTPRRPRRASAGAPASSGRSASTRPAIACCQSSRALGVDCVGPRNGRTGTIVVARRTRRRAHDVQRPRLGADLTRATTHWLDGVAVLHVPYYSLADAPIAVRRELLLEARRANEASSSRWIPRQSRARGAARIRRSW